MNRRTNAETKGIDASLDEKIRELPPISIIFDCFRNEQHTALEYVK